MKLGLRHFGEGSGRDIIEADVKDVLLTRDGEGLVGITDLGTVPTEVADRLWDIAPVKSEHPLGEGGFLVLSMGAVWECLGKDPSSLWDRNALCILLVQLVRKKRQR